MNAEIVAVGTELLLGEILNSDTQFLASELSKLGINVFYQTVVGDNHDRLLELLKKAIDRSDIIITSGGLGPTHDDITKETLCEAMGVEMAFDQLSYDNMKSYFDNIGREMAEVNMKQAIMPIGGIVLKNNHGTAPGGIIEKNGKIAIFLPGPPREIKPMYFESVKPYLMQKSTDILYSKTLRIFGIGESSVEQILSDLMRNSHNPTVAPYAKTDEVTLRITAKCKTEEDGKKLIEPVEAKIRDILGDVVYGINDDTIATAAFNLLKENHKTIAFAESCTGGLLAKTITDMSGASEVFAYGMVTYSCEAKAKILGVSKESLEKYGAVSEQVCREMAEGVLKLSGADFGVSTTGVAGPNKDDRGNDVGLVYVGIATKNGTKCYEVRSNGEREKVRNRACMEAFSYIRKELLK